MFKLIYLRRNIWMPNSCIKLHLRWFIRIFSRNYYVYLEITICIRSVSWTIDKSFPMCNVSIHKKNRDSRVFPLKIIVYFSTFFYLSLKSESSLFKRFYCVFYIINKYKHYHFKLSKQSKPIFLSLYFSIR